MNRASTSQTETIRQFGCVFPNFPCLEYMILHDTLMSISWFLGSNSHVQMQSFPAPRVHLLGVCFPIAARPKECVKVEPRKQRRKQVDSRSTFKYSCAPYCTIIYGQFSAKATAKDITKHMSPRKPRLCARKNRESRRESL